MRSCEVRWVDLDDGDERRVARIRSAVAQYSEFMVDPNNANSEEAFWFAETAAIDYLPWCVQRLKQLQADLVKSAIRNHQSQTTPGPPGA